MDLADHALYRGKEQGRDRVNVSIVRGPQVQLRALEFRDGQETTSTETSA